MLRSFTNETQSCKTGPGDTDRPMKLFTFTFNYTHVYNGNAVTAVLVMKVQRCVRRIDQNTRRHLQWGDQIGFSDWKIFRCFIVLQQACDTKNDHFNKKIVMSRGPNIAQAYTVIDWYVGLLIQDDNTLIICNGIQNYVNKYCHYITEVGSNHAKQCTLSDPLLM